MEPWTRFLLALAFLGPQPIVFGVPLSSRNSEVSRSSSSSSTCLRTRVDFNGLCSYQGFFSLADECNQFLVCLPSVNNGLAAYVANCPEGKEFSHIMRTCVDEKFSECGKSVSSGFVGHESHSFASHSSSKRQQLEFYVKKYQELLGVLEKIKQLSIQELQEPSGASFDQLEEIFGQKEAAASSAHGSGASKVTKEEFEVDFSSTSTGKEDFAAEISKVIAEKIRESIQANLPEGSRITESKFTFQEKPVKITESERKTEKTEFVAIDESELAEKIRESIQASLPEGSRITETKFTFHEEPVRITESETEFIETEESAFEEAGVSEASEVEFVLEQEQSGAIDLEEAAATEFQIEEEEQVAASKVTVIKTEAETEGETETVLVVTTGEDFGVQGEAAVEIEEVLIAGGAAQEEVSQSEFEEEFIQVEGDEEFVEIIEPEIESDVFVEEELTEFGAQIEEEAEVNHELEFVEVVQVEIESEIAAEVEVEFASASQVETAEFETEAAGEFETEAGADVFELVNTDVAPLVPILPQAYEDQEALVDVDLTAVNDVFNSQVETVLRESEVDEVLAQSGVLEEVAEILEQGGLSDVTRVLDTETVESVVGSALEGEEVQSVAGVLVSEDGVLTTVFDHGHGATDGLMQEGGVEEMLQGAELSKVTETLTGLTEGSPAADALDLERVTGLLSESESDALPLADTLDGDNLMSTASGLLTEGGALQEAEALDTVSSLLGEEAGPLKALNTDSLAGILGEENPLSSAGELTEIFGAEESPVSSLTEGEVLETVSSLVGGEGGQLEQVTGVLGEEGGSPIGTVGELAELDQLAAVQDMLGGDELVPLGALGEEAGLTDTLSSLTGGEGADGLVPLESLPASDAMDVLALDSLFGSQGSDDAEAGGLTDMFGAEGSPVSDLTSEGGVMETVSGLASGDGEQLEQVTGLLGQEELADLDRIEAIQDMLGGEAASPLDALGEDAGLSDTLTSLTGEGVGELVPLEGLPASDAMDVLALDKLFGSEGAEAADAGALAGAQEVLGGDSISELAPVSEILGSGGEESDLLSQDGVTGLVDNFGATDALPMDAVSSLLGSESEGEPLDQVSDVLQLENLQKEGVMEFADLDAVHMLSEGAATDSLSALPVDRILDDGVPVLGEGVLENPLEAVPIFEDADAIQTVSGLLGGENTAADGAEAERVAGVLPNDALTEGILPSEALGEGLLPVDGLTEGFAPAEGLTKGILPAEGLTEGLLSEDGLSEGVLSQEGLTDTVLSEDGLTSSVLGGEGVAGLLTGGETADAEAEAAGAESGLLSNDRVTSLLGGVAVPDSLHGNGAGGYQVEEAESSSSGSVVSGVPVAGGLLGGGGGKKHGHGLGGLLGNKRKGAASTLGQPGVVAAPAPAAAAPATVQLYAGRDANFDLDEDKAVLGNSRIGGTQK